METIHQVIEGKILSQVISLPKSFQNILVEIIVKPSVENNKVTLTRENLYAQLRGSHTESLSGILKTQPDITLDEIRKERRVKYERID